MPDISPTAVSLTRLAVLLVCAGHAVAQQELWKLTPSDGGPNDLFGIQVSIGGDLAIIGASLDDDNGTDSGSAYVFDITTGQQKLKLLASDGAQDHRFGWDVSIHGHRAAIGAMGNKDNGLYSGAAYAFDLRTSQQISKMLASDGEAYDWFGYSVATFEDCVVIGAPMNTDNGPGSGSAYVFDLPLGRQLFKLLPSDGDSFDVFGIDVAVDGTRAIIGAYGNTDFGHDSGSAYLFDVTTGQQLHKLLPSDGGLKDRFGYSVSISGDLAVVGAPLDNAMGVDSGSAYVFDVTTGQQLFKLLPSDGGQEEEFGISVSICGDRAIIGAHDDDDNGDNAGAAYVFDVSTGQKLYKLTASDGTTDDKVGIAVSIIGDHAVVGAYGDDDHGSASGSAYVFHTPSLGTAFCFGDGSGTACSCGNNGSPGEGCANSAGTGGLLTAGGSDNASDDDARFYGSGLPPGQPALLFAGLDAINGGDGAPFGDGLRCLGGSLVRLGARTPDAAGRTTWGPGLRAQGGWGPGDTRRFQVWYRDPAGPCNSGFNLTNAVAVTFTL